MTNVTDFERILAKGRGLLYDVKMKEKFQKLVI